MTLILAIIAFVVIFSLLILIHEAGHFMAARKCGVRVEEFGLGMPPKLASFRPKGSETLYTFNAIPFGGFVRLYGEDSSDPKLMKDKHSFAAQSVWKKIAIIVAGVTMNFLLAFVLLALCNVVGTQPLLLGPEDVFHAIDSGVVSVAEGVIVKAPGENDIGFQAEDRIVSVNGNSIVEGDELTSLKEGQQVKFMVERSDKLLELKGVNQLKKPFFKLYDALYVPRIYVKELAPGSNLDKAGVKSGDRLEKVGNAGIYGFEDLEKYLTVAGVKYEVKKGAAEFPVLPVKNHQPVLMIGSVLPGSPADKIGLKVGDEVLSIKGVEIKKTDDLAKALADRKPLTKITYRVSRGGGEVEYFVETDVAGMVGISFSELHRADHDQTSYYLKPVMYSVKKISEVSYPWYQVPGQTLQEMGRLTVLTTQMFGNVFSSIFTRFSVPEGVAGPVGIAQMTYSFVQEGVMSLVRFTALLSLSLAIINILPFPGLDGGRLFLIIVPLILRKKLNPRLETLIHLGGFVVLMLLILVITFNDIFRIFSGV